MTVKSTSTGKWLVHIDRKGIPRIRRTFNDETKAEIFEREYLAKYMAKQQSATDQRTLKELVGLWFRYHGINLADGDRRKTCLEDMATALDNPQASALTAEQFVNYRFTRLQAGLTDKTFNNHHGYLSAMFNKLSKLRVIEYDNPISEVDFIKIHERQLSFISSSQINTLLESIKSGCLTQVRHLI